MQVAPSISPALAPPLPSKGWMRLSPINRRRLENFRANRRGHASFWLFSVLFVLFAVFSLACYEVGFRVGRWWQRRMQACGCCRC